MIILDLYNKAGIYEMMVPIMLLVGCSKCVKNHIEKERSRATINNNNRKQNKQTKREIQNIYSHLNENNKNII